MAKFIFHEDTQIVCFTRKTYEVEATSKEDALKKVISVKKELVEVGDYTDGDILGMFQETAQDTGYVELVDDENERIVKSFGNNHFKTK